MEELRTARYGGRKAETAPLLATAGRRAVVRAGIRGGMVVGDVMLSTSLPSRSIDIPISEFGLITCGSRAKPACCHRARANELAE